MALVEDPKPYRKDVKSLLSNFLLLNEKLDMDDIDRPRYSLKIRLRTKLKF